MPNATPSRRARTGVLALVAGAGAALLLVLAAFTVVHGALGAAQAEPSRVRSR